MKSFNIKFSSLLFYLIPFALLTGPFLPDLFASIISVIFLINIYFLKQYNYLRNSFFILFIIFYLYLVINSILSDFPILSLNSSLFYFRFGLFALATWYLIENNKNFILIFSQVLLITILFALLNGYIQYFTGENLFGISPDIPSRLTLTLNDRHVLGGYIVRLIPLLIATILITSRNIKFKYIVICLIFVLSDVLIYLSGERTALGLILVLTIFLLISLSKFQILRILSVILSAILILIISIYSPSTKERVVDYTLEQIVQEQEGQQKIIYFSPIHDSLARTSINIFQDKLLFGSGPNTFREVCNKDEYKEGNHFCSTHPHNIYLQLLSETGITGIIPIFFVILYIFYIILRHLFSIITFKEIKFLSDYQLCLIACFILTLWPLLPTQDFFNNWINVIFFIPVGFYLSSIYSVKYEKYEK